MSDDTINQWDAYAMQDCIRGLTKERDNWKEAYRSISNDLSLLLRENDGLNAKLAKAVGSLVSLEKQSSITSSRGAARGPHWTQLSISILNARTTLAELKGEKYD